MRSLKCARCGGDMGFLMREAFQKGDSGAWVGNLNPHFRGGFEMEVYACGKCGKLEFFLPRQPEEDTAFDYEGSAVLGDISSMSEDGMPQVRCPACGRQHDFDYPKCPHCGYDPNAK